MRWVWDETKNRANKRRHRLGFETAQLVFDDPLAITIADSYPNEQRWRTIGEIESVIFIVVHTWPDRKTGTETGRIISARKATPSERRNYEEYP